MKLQQNQNSNNDVISVEEVEFILDQNYINYNSIVDNHNNFDLDKAFMNKE